MSQDDHDLYRPSYLTPRYGTTSDPGESVTEPIGTEPTTPIGTEPTTPLTDATLPLAVDPMPSSASERPMPGPDFAGETYGAPTPRSATGPAPMPIPIPTASPPANPYGYAPAPTTQTGPYGQSSAGSSPYPPVAGAPNPYGTSLYGGPAQAPAYGGYSPGYGYGYGGGYGYLPSHPNSGLVLGLGIASLFFGILAPIAWIMGHRARSEINAGAPYRSDGALTTGYVLGMIITILGGLLVGLWLFMVVILWNV